MAKHNEIGRVGEALAAKWLISRDFTVIELNYTQKWGEIDIVARETDIIHFIEVKTVSYETKSALDHAVSHETWRPEDNVHSGKLLKLGRTIETWLIEHDYEGKWVFDVVTVRVVSREKYAKIKILENLVIE